MAIIDSRTWPVVKGGEPLKRYLVRPGVSIKLTEAQARQRGFLPPEPEPEPETKRKVTAQNKRLETAPNKRRRVASNKQVQAEVPPEPEDDPSVAEDTAALRAGE